MRQALRTTALLLAAMLAGYVGGLLGQAHHSAQAQEQEAQEQEVLRAKAFMLVDAAGKPRGMFGFNADGDPTLELYDAAGKRRGAFGFDVTKQPRLSLFDAAGKTRGEFLLMGGEQPCLLLYDAAGKTRGEFLMMGGVPNLGLYNAAGKAIWSAL